jgi:DNA topoisomerase-1
MPQDVPVEHAPVEHARAAGLVHATDAEPGIARRRAGRGFRYVGPDGAPVRDKATLERIRKLAIPPAYVRVWISPDPLGHLQATGYDNRGRKQYRYHPRWRVVRDEAKFDRMAIFGRGLPRLRRRVRHDLRQPGLTKTKVVAAVVRLLESTLVRVGNERYAQDNDSFGLTTLRKRHVAVAGPRIRFEFRAKGGKTQEVELRDPRLARIIRSCRDLPGQRLFRYFDENGVSHPIFSQDVNDYVKEATGHDFTAKDFRTWSATLLAAALLGRQKLPQGEAAAKRTVNRCVSMVAAALGNTPTVCRKSYIHPGIFQAFLQGEMKAPRLPQIAMQPADIAHARTTILRLTARRLAASSAL